MNKTDKTQQPGLQDSRGPWAASVHRPEVKGRRGGFQGWSKIYISVHIEHEPLSYTLMGESYDATNPINRERLLEDLDIAFSVTGALQFFNDQPEGLKQSIIDMFDALIARDSIPAKLTSIHED